MTIMHYVPNYSSGKLDAWEGGGQGGEREVSNKGKC